MGVKESAVQVKEEKAIKIMTGRIMYDRTSFSKHLLVFVTQEEVIVVMFVDNKKLREEQTMADNSL